MYRPDRILALVRPEALERARQTWSAFRGNAGDTALVAPKGSVSSGDLPALFVLKGMIDRRLIEAGWWGDAVLRIDATQGSTLQILASPEQKSRIIQWIREIGSDASEGGRNSTSDENFAWAREVATHHFAEAQMDLQSLTWQQDPMGQVQNIQTVSAPHVRDVARIYYSVF
jgi:hypothetical protein